MISALPSTPKKFKLRTLVVLIPIFLFLVIIAVLKWGTYKRDKEFYGEEFHSRIEKIETSRGTRVYLNNAGFFYTARYKGPQLQVGDFLIKQDSQIAVYRPINNEKVHIGNGYALKPKGSYFEYFMPW